VVRAAQAEILIPVAPVRRRWLLGATVGATAGVAVGWLLAAPQGSSWVRALSLCAGVTVLGLAALGVAVRGDRRPPVALADLWRAIAALGGVWLACEGALLMFQAAAVAGVPVTRLDTARFTQFAGTVGSGRIGVAAFVGVAVCTLVAVVAYRQRASWPTAPVLAVAATALIARPVSGHMSQQILGSLFDALHVLAAGLWVGVLAALALTVRSRGAWARSLPRYSSLAVWCVVVLTATGVIDAMVRLGSVSALVDTGYGRIVLAKAVVLAGLMGLASWWRRTWVPAAAAHRATAEVSLRNAVLEVCATSVALGLAAALATAA
jgi:putative copper resistance protein D